MTGPSDTGAAGAATSAASQLGSSIGGALLNTIAATAAASYLAAHASPSRAVGTVQDFAVAMICGANIDEGCAGRRGSNDDAWRPCRVERT